MLLLFVVASAMLVITRKSNVGNDIYWFFTYNNKTNTSIFMAENTNSLEVMVSGFRCVINYGPKPLIHIYTHGNTTVEGFKPASNKVLNYLLSEGFINSMNVAVKLFNCKPNSGNSNNNNPPPTNFGGDDDNNNGDDGLCGAGGCGGS
jgi:hypothetical protein